MGSTQAVAEEGTPAQSFEEGVESFVEESKGQGPVEGHIIRPNAGISQLRLNNPGEPEPDVARRERRSFWESLEDFNAYMQDAGKLVKLAKDAQNPNAQRKEFIFHSPMDPDSVVFLDDSD